MIYKQINFLCSCMVWQNYSSSPEKQARNYFGWVWPLIRRISGTVWESDGEIFFSYFSQWKGRQTKPFNRALSLKTKWMTSFLCAAQVSSKVKRAYPADPAHQFNHKHDLGWFLHCSRAECTTQGVKVWAGSKGKQVILRLCFPVFGAIC